MVFLSSPIFGMDYLNQIKRWLTEIPQKEQLQSPEFIQFEQITQLPELPSDIQTSEIVKQILNISNTRDEALTVLSNYARVNKAIADYIKINKEALQKLLDQKFGLSLTVLASGNYNDPKIKAESLRVLEEGLKQMPAVRDHINELIYAIKNKNKIIWDNDLASYLEILCTASLSEKYEIFAATLGTLNNFFNNTRFTFTDEIGHQLLYLVTFNINAFGKDKTLTQISTLIINMVIKIFGPGFVSNTKIGKSKYGIKKTVLDWAKDTGNKEAINYLEKINKLNR